MTSADMARAASNHRNESPRDCTAKTVAWVKTKVNSGSALASASLKRCAVLLAEWDAAKGRLTVSGAAKVPFFNRRILAKQMDLPEDAIDMIENDVGGGYGARGEFYPEDFLIPFSARYICRPVKWTEDRRENLMAMNHAGYPFAHPGYGSEAQH